MRRFILALAFIDPLLAEQCPDWVVRGIAKVETRSVWRDVGDVTYVNRKDGADGEVGFMQLTEIALRQLKKLHLRDRCRKDVVLCESLAREYLDWLHARAGTWERAVAMYNVGPSGPIDVGLQYFKKVKAASTASKEKP